MIDILPCPFCNNSPRLCSKDVDNWATREYSIICDECDVKMKSDVDFTGWRHMEDDKTWANEDLVVNHIINKWNKRAS